MIKSQVYSSTFHKKLDTKFNRIFLALTYPILTTDEKKFCSHCAHDFLFKRILPQTGLSGTFYKIYLSTTSNFSEIDDLILRSTFCISNSHPERYRNFYESKFSSLRNSQRRMKNYSQYLGTMSCSTVVEGSMFAFFSSKHLVSHSG